MFPVYEEKKKNLHIHLRTSAHASPHLHNSIEFIYITEGTLELGMGQELYHMEKGDFAVIFPDVIHHYQVFSPGENKAVYLWAKPVLTGQFADIIQNTAGAVSLETMFVDEGFGSLDDQSRERAIRILKELAGEKGLVGIISHVNELKEQIDWKLTVTKSGHGSHARWII